MTYADTVPQTTRTLLQIRAVIIELRRDLLLQQFMDEETGAHLDIEDACVALGDALDAVKVANKKLAELEEVG